MLLKVFCVFALLYVQNSAECAKILGIFQVPSQSHHILGDVLLKALAKRGHQVTMVSPFLEKNPGPNYTSIQLDGVLEVKDEFMAEFINATSKLTQMFYAMKIMPKLYSTIINHHQFTKLANSGEKYDVAIIFAGFFEPLLGVIDKLEAQPIAFSTMGANFFTTYHIRCPLPFSYVPHLNLPYTDKMTFFQRVTNTLMSLATGAMFEVLLMPFMKKLYENNFPNGKPLQELVDNVDLYLMNSHFSTETLRPYLPNMIQIGGFHLQSDEDLPEDLQKYLDGAVNGLVYVSFGTNVKADIFSKYQKNALINTLGKLKLKVLWKFDEEIQGLPENIRVEKWLPQKSILAHSNIKLFITHGGLGSIAEAIYNGVPMVGIPFFGDQESNVEEIVHQGFGVKIRKDELTEQNLFEAVQEILLNKSYKEKVYQQSILYREQPMNPLDKAIYWVEHVIKHKGAKHLRPQGKMLPFYQFYLLDVIALIAIVVLTCSLVMYYVTKKMFNLIGKIWGKCKKNKNVKIKSQ